MILGIIGLLMGYLIGRASGRNAEWAYLWEEFEGFRPEVTVGELVHAHRTQQCMHGFRREE